MKRFTACLLALMALSATAAHALEAPRALDDLLERLRQEESADQKHASDFLALGLKQQEKLLLKAKARIAAEEQRQHARRQDFVLNEREIKKLKAKLKKEGAPLDKLFSMVRRQAKETAEVLKTSLVSAQKPGRTKILEEIAAKKTPPTIQEMEALWLMLLEEMKASGAVTRFSAPVISAEGQEEKAQVTRIGPFNLISEGRYLRYLPESGQLASFKRQVSPRFADMAWRLENATGGVAPVGIDPSRGAVLSLLTQRPDTIEQVRQGGLVGYFILALGGIALLMVCERLAYLSWVGWRIYAQIKADCPSLNNALGRILSVYTKNPEQPLEVLEHRLDEAILKEIPPLERGLKTLSVLASMAPLLGLLGTVTGMIETFQSITLFGVDDPKLLSGGISRALVTTELGLLVAIPMILLHSVISGKSRRLVQILDEQSAGIVARFAEKKI